MDNKYIISALLIIGIIMLATQVLALDISAPYWNSNPLKMYPGESREISFTLSNSINEKASAKAQIKIEESQGIAELASQSEYIVPPGSNNNKVKLKISIPSTANIGETYNVRFSVKSLPADEQANIQLNVAYNVEFPVQIISKSESDFMPREKNYATSILILILVIIIAIIAVFLLKKKKLK